jgi:hypothetical protein
MLIYTASIFDSQGSDSLTLVSRELRVSESDPWLAKMITFVNIGIKIKNQFYDQTLIYNAVQFSTD